MPRGAGKGGKTRKKIKNQDAYTRRPLIYKEEGQEYALVSKMLGSSRIECVCADQRKRICLIRGKMKNRVWIRAGDLVLISLREDLEEDKGDVIMKYTHDEFKDLKKEGELPDTLKMEDGIQYNSDDDVEFAESEHDASAKKDLQNFMPDSEDDDEEDKKEEIDIDAL